VSQTVQRTVAGITYKRNWKACEKEKRSWPKWRYHPDIRLDTLGKIMIKFRIAFPPRFYSGTCRVPVIDIALCSILSSYWLSVSQGNYCMLELVFIL